MTTEAAANFYLSQHLLEMQGRKFALHNPHNKSLEELPTIYGFNNGGRNDWWNGALIAQDGTGLGGHICSHESYMLHDLGILEGTRPDRHEKFKQHYPDGYKMTFISMANVRDHKELKEAFRLNQIKAKEAKEKKESQVE